VTAKVPARRSLRRLLTGGAVLLAAAACGRVEVQPGTSPLAALASLGLEAPAGAAPLSAVLARVQTDPAAAGVRGALDAYLSALARTGPRTRPGLFPTDADALAYLADAHMAWTIALGERRDLARLDPAALRGIRFPLDGRTATLREIAAELQRRAPFEARLALFLNPGWKGGAPLPESALEGPSLEWQLARHAARCGGAGFWALDAGAHRLAVSAVSASMWGLPEAPVARARRLLDLVPPPAALAGAIAAVCGASLERCTIVSAPLDTARLFGPVG
jgi:hypothetical protein